MNRPHTEGTRPVRDPSLLDALLPLVTLVVLIGGAILLFGLQALDGPIPAALVVCSMVAMLVAMKNGNTWDAVQEATNRAMESITGAIFILLAVGALIGTWCLSWTIPTLVYYGISVLSPAWYYAASTLICGIIAISIGSSWTTAGTIGVGLIGIAQMLGVSTSVTAGAVISGAYLGDKLSPLSETTIMTAQMVEVDVYEHIKRQAWTSVPAFLIGFILFFIIGLRTPSAVGVDTAVELKELDQVYNITVWNLVPLLLLIVLSVRKVPAALALMAAAVLAGVMAPFTQPDVVRTFADASTATLAESGLRAAWRAMARGFSIESGYADIDRLLSRGGMYSMLLTLWLIMGAVTFGTLLDEFGLIKRLIDPMVRAAKSTGMLFLTVFGNCFGLNIVAGDQYIALVLPARTFRAEFAKRGIHPTMLSRLCADAGTVTSPLVPWNSCGAFMSAVLGVATWSYLPFCFFNIASPILSVLYGFTGFKVERTAPQEIEPAPAQANDAASAKHAEAAD
jgi:NhaC family Na+:H+ antiporter